MIRNFILINTYKFSKENHSYYWKWKDYEKFQKVRKDIKNILKKHQ